MDRKTSRANRKADLLARIHSLRSRDGASCEEKKRDNQSNDIIPSPKGANNTGPETDEERKQKAILDEFASRRSIRSVHVGDETPSLLEPYWTPPAWSCSKKAQHYHRLSRYVFGIDVSEPNNHLNPEGHNNVPPLLTRFEDMKLPHSISNALLHNQPQPILWPQPIQMQAIPSVLERRDVIGVAHTGGGKTLAYGLGVILWAYSCECRSPCCPGEGPFALVIAPGRELASQIWMKLSEWAATLSPSIRILLTIGGLEKLDTIREHRSKGCHVVVGTPGRIKDLLDTRAKGGYGLHLVQCEMLVLDEADRLLDSIFEADVRGIVNYFHRTHQTVLFSATMSNTIINFARDCLRNPIVISSGDGGTTNKNVVQEFMFPVSITKRDTSTDVDSTIHPSVSLSVSENTERQCEEVDSYDIRPKFQCLIKALVKTQPPTVIFAVSNSEVELINDFLRSRSVGSVMLHSDMEQKSRLRSIDLFRNGLADVLVASDMASKGLDLPNVKHVINFNTPGCITEYIHRIGRTGRRMRGLSTTIITNEAKKEVLLDIRALLILSGQPVPPPFELLAKISPPPASGEPCPLCQGRGHILTSCPLYKLKKSASNSIQRRGVEADLM